jgi:glycosyltransferase involved in cell wall biosynthesis
MKFNFFLKKRKKTVLFVHHNLGLGGIQTKIIEIANETIQDKNTNVIVYLNKREKFDRSFLLKKRILVLYCPSFLSGLIKTRYYYLLILLIFIIRPSSIFVASEKESLFILKWVKKLKISVPVVVSVDIFLKKAQVYPDVLVNKFFNYAKSVITVSKISFLDLKQRLKIKEPPLVFIPNWIDKKTQNFKTFSKRKNDIIFLGRFDYPKQPFLLIDFIELVVKEGMTPQMKLYGKGKFKDKLKLEIKRKHLENNISVFDPIINTHLKLLNTKFIILTSKHEAMPLVLLEAMNAGCVVLSLDAPGVNDLIQDERTGICKKSLSELVDSYHQLNNDRNFYHYLQKRAFKEQQANYSNKNLKKVVDILLN